MSAGRAIFIRFALLSCATVLPWHSPTRVWSDAGGGLTDQTASHARVFSTISRHLISMARLDPATDIACDIEGQSRYVSVEALEWPQQLLFDGAVSDDQGIFTQAGEPLGIRLPFRTGQHVQCIQLVYAGVWRAPGIPEVPIVLQTPAGESHPVGALPPISTPPPSQPYTQQIVFPEDITDGQTDWRRLLLTISGLPDSLGLVEVRVIGYAATLRSLAGVAHQLAAQPEIGDVGTLSQIAAAVRARRLAGEKSDLQHQILRQLTAIITDISQVSVMLKILPERADADAFDAQIEVRNSSPHALEQAVVRLQVPAGWGVAQARMVIEPLTAGESIFLPVTVHPVQDSQQELSAYMYGAHNDEPLFLLAVLDDRDETSEK